MIGRRGFLALLPALVAGVTLARHTPPSPVLRAPIAYDGLLWSVDDGPWQSQYAGVTRDAYVAYYRWESTFACVHPATSFRIDSL